MCVLVNMIVRPGVVIKSLMNIRTMQSVLIGSEYPVMDTLLFYLALCQ